MFKQKTLIGGILPLALLSIGCSGFDSSLLETGKSLSSMQPPIITGEKAQAYEMELTAVSELVAELQVVQVDGLMVNQMARIQMSSSQSSGWGGVNQNLNTSPSASLIELDEAGKSFGWGGGAAGPRPNPSNNITTTRDCELGGTFVAKSKPVLRLPASIASKAFKEDTTPELSTDIQQASIEFKNCRVADGDNNEYRINGTLAATGAESASVFTISDADLSFNGSGVSNISGTLKVTSDAGTSDCDLSLATSVSASKGDVTLAHKSGKVDVSADMDGTLCGQTVQLKMQRSVGF